PIVLTPEAIARTRIVITQLAEAGECRIGGFEGKMRWGDARETFGQRAAGDRPLNTPPSDAIFLDPFSPPQCPQLWTLDFLTIVAQRLAPTGYLATYSCAAAVRSALLTAGLAIGASPPFGRRWPGTVAAYPSNVPNPMLPPLSPQELEHLQTRAAVPYRDRLGTGSRDEILACRRREQDASSLEPTSRWKRRWFGDCRASHRSQPELQSHLPSSPNQKFQIQ
ncbi:MAG: MnmC family methyltransferase, partial [Cyanobacteria bacterium P01_H01_bin.130]